MMPDSDTRPLALTSVKPRGSRRGTAAARVTPYALDETSTPSAAAKTSAEPLLTDDASTQQRNARTAIVAPIAQRRPCANRSRNGPISGATIAKGSIVRPRNSATWPRASPEGTWKNSAAGQGDRHRGVAGGVEDVHLDEPGQPRLAGPLGLRGAPGLRPP